MEQDITDNYQKRSASAASEAAKFSKLANTYSLLRLGVFALMILAIYLGIINNNMTIIVIAFVVLIFCFAWLVSKQGHFERLRNYHMDLQAVNDNELQSMQTGDNVYNNGSSYADDKHRYTADLDIFGKASLFQLINRAATAKGSGKLAGWLSAPADRLTILTPAGCSSGNQQKK